MANLRKLNKKEFVSLNEKKIINDTISLLKKADIKLEEQAERYCHWLQQDNEDSDCWLACDDKLFTVKNGTPKENDMLFCPYCGKNLVEISYNEQFPNEEADYEYI